jgi:hypothetical protein
VRTVTHFGVYTLGTALVGFPTLVLVVALDANNRAVAGYTGTVQFGSTDAGAILPESYQPDPTSRDYVIHLGAWYAQAHPAEDFAETFAVCLASPPSVWRRRHFNWPAMRKLEYVSRLMDEVAGKRPKNDTRRQVEPLSGLTMTLREHYRRKRQHYSFPWSTNYDRDLKRIFSADPRHASRPTAVSFLRGARRELIQRVADGTGLHHYTIDQLLSQIIERCKRLKLRLAGAREPARQQALVMLTVQTMNVVHTGYHRIPL